MSAAEWSTSRPRDHSAWSWDSTARRVSVVDQGNAVAHCPPAECSTSRPRDHSAWSWDSAARRVPVVDQGNAVAHCPRRSARRRGLGITRRGAGTRPLDVSPWSTRETRSLTVRGGVLDVEAWGSLGVELKLGRSAWHVVDQGNAVAYCPPAECSTSRPRDHSAWSWDSTARRVSVVDQGNAVAHCPPAECSTSRPGDHSTWS
jgi:hypothetical protein